MVSERSLILAACLFVAACAAPAYRDGDSVARVMPTKVVLGKAGVDG